MTLEAPMRNGAGEEAGTVGLSDSVFGATVHGASLHQALVRQQAGVRQGTHDTKTRGEVSGGGRKPYRQKGTGRARQGSIRAPHWRGGGTIFGPTPHRYGQSMPRKQRRLALRSALSAQASVAAIQVVSELNMERPRTAEIARLLDTVGAGRRVLLVLGERSSVIELSARNIPQLRVITAGNINVRDVLAAETILLTRSALTAIEEHLS